MDDSDEVMRQVRVLTRVEAVVIQGSLDSHGIARQSLVDMDARRAGQDVILEVLAHWKIRYYRYLTQWRKTIIQCGKQNL